MNFTDNFFQDIFQCDQTGSFTIFIQNNCDVKGCLTHLHKKLGNILILISKISFSHNIPDMEFFCVSVIVKQQVFHVNRTNHIVSRIFINRQPCEFIFAENVNQFFICAVYICKCYVNAGNHNIFSFCISEIYHIVDHFFLFGFDNAVFMADIYDSTKFILGHGAFVVIRIYAQNEKNNVGQTIDNEDERCHDLHKYMDDWCVYQRYLLSVDGSHCLRCNLTEKQNRYS